MSRTGNRHIVLSAIGLGVLMILVGAQQPWPAAADSLEAVRSDSRCNSGVAGDVNGDGWAEVPVGEPGNARDRGSVHVFYGHPSGLVFDSRGTARNDEYLSQDTAGVPGTGETGDRFGDSTILADVNGDGCADLVVGTPGEDAGSGRLTVFPGSPAGLRTSSGVGSWTTAQLFGSAVAGPGQRLGDTLAVGDLNGDGFADLASGLHGLTVGGVEDGGVAVLYGSRAGLNRGQRPLLLTRATPGVPGDPVAYGGFGMAVATGDFDGNGRVELAVGSTNGAAGGAVQVVAHVPGGGVKGDDPIGSDAKGMPGDQRRFCAFGFVLAAGDVHGDDRDDLAVADPSYGCRDEVEVEYGAGAVVLLPGSPAGLTTDGSQLWTQDSAGVEGSERLGHVFGESLAIGPLDRGPTDDLAIGAPFDGSGGSVTILLGSSGGLTTDGPGGTRFTQSTRGIVGTDEAYDNFGDTLVVARLQSRSQASLVIGAPGEDVGRVVDAGSATQLGVGTGGPDPLRSQTFTAGTRGIQGQARTAEAFGDSTRRWG